MIDQFVGVQTSSPARCEVCDIEVSMFDARLKKSQGYVVCRSFECRRIMKQKPSMSQSFFQRLAETKKRIVQARIARNLAEIERVEKLQAREAKENRLIRQLVRNRHPEVTDQTRMINLPSGLSELTATSKERIEKYEMHLRENIREAAKLADASELTDYIELKQRKKCLATEQRLDRNPELRMISDKMCGICKGGCCVLGKDHAFNTVSTMRRFMDLNPALTQAEVLAAYMDRIESETVEGSCINQTKTGCGLPREMRSDTCNGYYCDEIKSYHRDLSDSNRKLDPLITVQRAHTLWDRWTPEGNHEVIAAQLVDAWEVEALDLS
jgi:hypothetical protein